MYVLTVLYLYEAHNSQGNDILAALNADPTPSETLTKKEKQTLKREAFLHS